MNSFHVQLTSVFTIGFLAGTASCMHMDSLVTTRKNVFLKGHVIQRQWTTSQLSCMHLCLRKDRCLSFNYKLSSYTKGLCELSSGTAGRFNGGLLAGAGWIYGQLVRSKTIQPVEQNAESGKNFQISHLNFIVFVSRKWKKSASMYICALTSMCSMT